MNRRVTLSRAQHNTTAKAYAADGTPTFSELARRDAAVFGGLPCRFACRMCAWRFEGAVADGLPLAREHRLSHGWTGRGRRRR